MLEVNIQTEPVCNNVTEFKNLKIGDVFIVKSTVYPNTRSTAKPHVYMKTSCVYGLTYTNAMDLQTLTTTIINGNKVTELVQKAELNVVI